MKDLLVLLAHLMTTVAKFPVPSGARAVFADSLLMKQRLLVITKGDDRPPKTPRRLEEKLDCAGFVLTPNGSEL